jgi:hypothetical protein
MTRLEAEKILNDEIFQSPELAVARIWIAAFEKLGMLNFKSAADRLGISAKCLNRYRGRLTAIETLTGRTIGKKSEHFCYVIGKDEACAIVDYLESAGLKIA